ncbi:hypothetical protein [Microvirga lenta]|uniref:hypothetical protein n=1 Tax=Microvirga lenta TaxID=2881337 RepID=UPI001CFFD66E|nr:hypothetical protein [Microvirga lenta]MCB5177589.1 hypothetical protein [Microvirga lenta]
MKKSTILKNRNHRVVAHIEIDSRGIHTITDQYHRALGYFDPRTNRSSDRHHRVIGYGYLLAKLVPADLSEEEAGVIKPKKPLSPEQTMRAAEKRTQVQKQISKAQVQHADKLRDLRDKL